MGYVYVLWLGIAEAQGGREVPIRSCADTQALLTEGTYQGSAFAGESVASRKWQRVGCLAARCAAVRWLHR